MNIININYEEMIKEILLYKDKYKCNPVILMSNETFVLLEKETKKYCYVEAKMVNIKTYPTFWGCNIAIAEWLSLGEVEIR